MIGPQQLSCRGTNVTNGTVSEGIGYGMLAAVYMATGRPSTACGPTPSRTSTQGADELVHPPRRQPPHGMGSATDGDEDMAWALVMAADQWGDRSYLMTRGRHQRHARQLHSGDGMLRAGDNSGRHQGHYPDYFSPAYFRVFAAAPVTINGRRYPRLELRPLGHGLGNHGLVPDSTPRTDIQHLSEHANYGYDACRMPWRIAMDYCFNGEPRAQTYLSKVGAFFDGIGASNIGDGYSLTGSKTSSNQNMAFIGPAGVAGMAGYPQLLDGAFNFGSATGNGNDAYFPQSLRVVTMLMMSGNFLDYTQRKQAPAERADAAEVSSAHCVMSQKLPLIAISDSTPHEAWIVGEGPVDLHLRCRWCPP